MKFATRTILSGFLSGALLAFAAAASAAVASGEVTQDFHRTVPLSANGTVSLENINGNAEITGWDRNEVQIDAVKTARDQQRLQEAQIIVEASSNSVHIETKYPQNHTNNNPASVHYTLHLPSGAHLDKVDLVNGSLTVERVSGDVHANLVNGSLHASDLAGEASFSSVNGSVKAAYTSLKNNPGIRIKSVNGSIDLLLPESPNAQVHASTVSGSIRSEFPLTVKGGFVGHNVDGTLGSGGSKIDLTNVNGSIHIGPGRSSL